MKIILLIQIFLTSNILFAGSAHWGYCKGKLAYSDANYKKRNKSADYICSLDFGTRKQGESKMSKGKR